MPAWLWASWLNFPPAGVVRDRVASQGRSPRDCKELVKMLSLEFSVSLV